MIKYLLGATKDHQIVFAKFGITFRNEYPEFTASFDVVRPFRESSIDLEEYFENWLDGLDAEWKYEACCQRDCTPRQLPRELADECCDVSNAIDCSLYPESITVEDEEWFFASSNGGQYDTRGEMGTFTNYHAYQKLHSLWDKYHLKRVEPDVIAQVLDLQTQFGSVKVERWIRRYIEDNYDELVDLEGEI